MYDRRSRHRRIKTNIAMSAWMPQTSCLNVHLRLPSDEVYHFCLPSLLISCPVTMVFIKNPTFMFLSALAALSFLAMEIQADCRPMCCDAVVPSISPSRKVGLNCSKGGLDCGFSGQIQACCGRISPFGQSSGTGIDCQ
ncbi:MAG: hypothetical protein JOS17DRAFT_368021 [Linnemannia elongata]|nr:MAG: hypothetical protein JOS17DRAFT_368021 [Linnemannia elongata]